MNNILRIRHVNVIGDIILFLGKLCVILLSAISAFLMLDTHKYRAAYKLLPVLVCWVFEYIVATLFFRFVEMSIDTIIFSYYHDSEDDGTTLYAPPLLMETLNNDQNGCKDLHKDPNEICPM
ncbi:hypothetical protein HN51_028625, partial [Arachis hypogaea]